MSIHVSTFGEGPAVVYLHGFLETSDIWPEFAKKIEGFKHYCFDLPGFGKSSLLKEEFTLEEIAQEIEAKIKELELNQFHLVGHSLGGYVGLACLKSFPQSISSITLFHSTSLPDSPEKKENRTKTIKFVEENGVAIFAQNFVKPLFAESNHPMINYVESLAEQAKKETVMAYLAAMRERPDHTTTLITSKKPAFIILGEKDTVINHLQVQQALGNQPTIKISLLKNSGHMGMFEEPELTSELLGNFFNRI